MACSDAKIAMVVPAINGFLDDHYSKHLRLKAPKRENADRTINEIRKLGDVLPGPLNTVDEKAVLDWVYAELETEIGPERYIRPSTVARKLKSLRGLFTLAIGHGVIDSNPVAEIQKNHLALLDEAKAAMSG